MKSKYLTPIALLIFFLPFLRMCTKTVTIPVESIDGLTTEKLGKDSLVSSLKENDILKEPTLSLAKEDISLNAYQLGRIFFWDEKFKLMDFKELKEVIDDIEFYAIISYTFIILFSVLMIVFSWRKKYLVVRNLSIVNSLLLVISTLILVKSVFIDDFADVKYGWYVFLLYSMFVIYISNKELVNQNLKT